MENAQIADIFDRMADLLELKDEDPFRIRSYRNTARTLRDMSERVEDLVHAGKSLSDFPNIGKSSEDKIREILKTGTCARLEELQRDVPEGLPDLMKIPSVGPRTAIELYRKLGIHTVAQLKKACEKHELQSKAHMGEKTEAKILKGIQILESSEGRISLKQATDQVESIERLIKTIPAITKWEAAGSYRRGRETVGDLDLLLHANERKAAIQELQKYTDIAETISQGDEWLNVRLKSGLRVDFRFFELEAFGAALMYFTGSKAHNIVLRKRAQSHGWKLNEYGLFKGNRRIAGDSETAVYQQLNLMWIPPELREDTGELEASEKEALPHLIELKQIKGDLHCHTTATDGANTIEEMARAAIERGYEYIAITDHSKSTRVAGGLDETRLKKHVENIRKTDRRHKNFSLLAGVEVDIRKDGHLDIDEKLLAELDWVVASIHSHFQLSRDETTERLIKAVESGVIHCLGHPTARLIGQRDPIQYDFDKVLEACRDHHVLMEINSAPERMDLPDFLCRRARDAGVKFVISTDAHKTTDYDFIRYGITVARRGWLTRHDVLNTVGAVSLRKQLARC
jgi:DNA polymerase (family 10)